ncbi:GNAT family N-acetyltransferase [Roseomonas sp. CCTCC AB2023176]|uniref:GNAT family N-acetyltransferase n=1 Tax=Roseomonas sp. CCTCC AB2023176 TaxID=3342640 RepID=UPI0035E1ECF0
MTVAPARAGLEVRDARPEDAEAACDVLRRSIVALCGEDHRGDPDRLAAWLANKTPGNVLAWMRQAGHSLLVAAEEGRVLAVGGVTDAGQVTLNYVAPEARFQGVSRAMLRALEDRARERGAARLSLTSTATARRFYVAAGYREDVAAAPSAPVDSGVAMSKPIPGGPPED